jgi:hypothetical protein
MLEVLRNCPGLLIYTMNELRPISGIKNMKFQHDNERSHVKSPIIRHPRQIFGFLIILKSIPRP